jgi:NADPH:quinone reductase-like Zn-dependent oxidoreductase
MKNTHTMKAIRIDRFGGPETLALQDVPRPTPAAGELLVRVQAAAINPIDWKLREGLFRDLKLPFTPGGDFCGTVEEVGPGVTTYEKGDSVFGVAQDSVGADAEFLAVPQSNLSLKPVSLGPVEAASVPLAGMTAWQGLYVHGGLQGSQRVLILGASGGVGSFAVQLAKMTGARVIGTASTENLARMRDLGCDEVIDYTKQGFEGVAHGVELCLDLVGGEFQRRAFKSVKRGGRLISTVQPPDDGLAREAGITARFFRMKPDAAQLRELAVRIDAGDLKVAVAKILPLEEAAQAEELNRRQKAEGKIVLQVCR